MNKEDIIRMAREAGLLDNGVLRGATDDSVRVERFAALVSAECEKQWHKVIHDECEAVIKEEREACAKVCDDTGAGLWAVYKGRSKDDLLKRGRGSEYVQGAADQCDLLYAAIRARK